MNKFVKYPLVLGVIALISAGLLSGTYHLTKDRIELSRIERQTSAINDMFKTIDSRTLLDVPAEFAVEGIESIIEVESKGKKYNCYTISYNDSADGDPVTMIIALDSNGKLYNVKFVTVDSYIKNNYANEAYLNTSIKNDAFDAKSNATSTANDLKAALKLAKDCFKGELSDPIEEVFPNMTSKEELQLPQNVNSIIKHIYEVKENDNTYYVFDVEYGDGYGGVIQVLYALNENETLYKLRVLKGDSYEMQYDGATSLDIISFATGSGQDFQAKFNIVRNCLRGMK